jgi:hypothetical protein
MGMKMITTVSMVFTVCRHEDELKAARLYFGSTLDGNMFGNSPMTP